MFVVNLLLMLTWVVLNNAYTAADFLVGFSLGFCVILLSWRIVTREGLSARKYFKLKPGPNIVVKIWRWAAFCVYAFWAIIKSNIEVARIVLSPRPKYQPGIVAIPLDVKSDGGITLLANLITLTPGTVTLDVASDRKTIYIHTLNVEDAEALRRDTKQDFERRVMELLP